MEFQYAFFAVFAAIVAYWLFQVSTKGFKGALFGGAIERTVGGITLARRGILGTAAMRKPAPAFSAETRAEVDYLLARLAKHDPRARI